MEPEKKSNGALVGLAVIIIILVVGGVYIWKVNKAARDKMEQESTQSGTITNQDSADLNVLEQDAQKTDTNTNVDVNSVN